MNIETFIKELEKINIKPTEQELLYLKIYKDMLKEYNKKFNLTAITDDDDIYLKHFYDSLTLINSVSLNGNLKVLDIGTGAGFPGLVLKIFFPNLKLTLLDSNNKKIMFLKEVIEALNLQDVNCIHARAEELPNEYREYFDVITSRAVAPLRILTELSIPFLKVKGLFIPMKGAAEEEIKESASTLKVLNCKIINIIEFRLPQEDSKRTIIKIEKEAKTPDKYPRIYDQIKKKTLK